MKWILFNLFEWSWTIHSERERRKDCIFATVLFSLRMRIRKNCFADFFCVLLLFFPSAPPPSRSWSSSSSLFFISPLIQMNKAHNSSAINSLRRPCRSGPRKSALRRISPNKSKPFCARSRFRFIVGTHRRRLCLLFPLSSYIPHKREKF